MAEGRTSSRRDNNTFRGAALQYNTREEELAAFDALEWPLRWMLQENATKLSAVRVEMFVADITRQANDRQEAVHYTMRRLVSLERNEIEVFAGQHLAQYRKAYPFLCAGVSVMRYGPLGPSRFPPRRFRRVRGFRIPPDVPEVAAA